jgi:hypothetical protein
MRIILAVVAPLRSPPRWAVLLVSALLGCTRPACRSRSPCALLWPWWCLPAATRIIVAVVVPLRSPPALADDGANRCAVHVVPLVTPHVVRHACLKIVDFLLSFLYNKTGMNGFPLVLLFKMYRNDWTSYRTSIETYRNEWISFGFAIEK